jgi:putative transposase
MVKKDPARKRYPSDLTNEQWAIVAPLIPPAKSGPRGGHPRQVDMREVLNTLFFLNRSGCQWDMLPHDLLPKSTVYDYFAQWRDDGTWAKMVMALHERTRVAAGREPTPVPRASTVNPSRPPKWGPPSGGMTVAKKSRDASAISWSIRWGCCSPCSLPVLVSMMGWQPQPCSASSHPRPVHVSSRSLRIRSIITMRWTPGWLSIGLAGASK